jgi:hypothetical protein
VLCVARQTRPSVPQPPGFILLAAVLDGRSLAIRMVHAGASCVLAHRNASCAVPLRDRSPAPIRPVHNRARVRSATTAVSGKDLILPGFPAARAIPRMFGLCRQRLVPTTTAMGGLTWMAFVRQLGSRREPKPPHGSQGGKPKPGALCKNSVWIVLARCTLSWGSRVPAGTQGDERPDSGWAPALRPIPSTTTKVTFGLSP